MRTEEICGDAQWAEFYDANIVYQARRDVSFFVEESRRAHLDREAPEVRARGARPGGHAGVRSGEAFRSGHRRDDYYAHRMWAMIGTVLS